MAVRGPSLLSVATGRMERPGREQFSRATDGVATTEATLDLSQRGRSAGGIRQEPHHTMWTFRVMSVPRRGKTSPQASWASSDVSVLPQLRDQREGRGSTDALGLTIAIAST